MKIKDIILEQDEMPTGPSDVNSFKILNKNRGTAAKGFFSGLIGGLKPKAFQDIERTKSGPDLTSTQAAQQAHKEFGDNPESPFSGFYGWLSSEEQDKLMADNIKAYKQKEKEKQKQKVAKGKERLEKDIQSQFDQFGTTSQRTAATQTTTQSSPPQVRLSSGEFITKYGGSWYNEQGQQVTAPNDIASLERRVQKPSGQAQMATTKNVPVNLPGYKGKR